MQLCTAFNKTLVRPVYSFMYVHNLHALLGKPCSQVCHMDLALDFEAFDFEAFAGRALTGPASQVQGTLTTGVSFRAKVRVLKPARTIMRQATKEGLVQLAPQTKPMLARGRGHGRVTMCSTIQQAPVWS